MCHTLGVRVPHFGGVPWRAQSVAKVWQHATHLQYRCGEVCQKCDRCHTMTPSAPPPECAKSVLAALLRYMSGQGCQIAQSVVTTLRRFGLVSGVCQGAARGTQPATIIQQCRHRAPQACATPRCLYYRCHRLTPLTNIHRHASYTVCGVVVDGGSTHPQNY